MEMEKEGDVEMEVEGQGKNGGGRRGKGREGRGTYVEGGWKRGGNVEMEVEGVERIEVELEVERESGREERIC